MYMHVQREINTYTVYTYVRVCACIYNGGVEVERGIPCFCFVLCVSRRAAGRGVDRMR